MVESTRNTPRTIASVADLTPDPRNANRGTPRGRALLEESLRVNGAGRSILVDRHGVVIAGNKTFEQARAQNFPIQVIETTGEELVVVQRQDLDLGQDARARQLALADNRVAELDLDWDPAVLEQHLAEGVPLQPLFSQDELEQLLGHGVGFQKDGTLVFQNLSPLSCSLARARS